MTIEWKGSPNFSSRNGTPIRKIVIHWFGLGTLESADARFQNPAIQVSAHYGISKGRIWQWVKEEDTSWHAGNLIVNKESIGIEHDAIRNHILSEEDYKLSGELVKDICKRYNIPIDRQHIISHNEVVATQCPGTVDIDKIIKLTQTSQTKVVVSKNSPTVYVCYPMPTMEYLTEKARLEGFEIPPQIPNTDTL